MVIYIVIAIDIMGLYHHVMLVTCCSLYISLVCLDLMFIYFIENSYINVIW